MAGAALRTTLVLIFRGKNILLGYKKRGFGKDKWNGFGGKVQKNESLPEAACREVKEECGLTVKEHDLQRIGLLQFEFAGENNDIDVDVFRTENFQGEIEESEEMRGEWFSLSEIPFDQMWADDRMWFPFLLSGKLFWGKFLFQGHDVILSHQLEEVGTVEDLDMKRYCR